MDVGDLPCCCWVGVCEGVSDGESSARGHLEQFPLIEVALACLLVGLGASQGKQDEEQDEAEGYEGRTHGGEGSAGR